MVSRHYAVSLASQIFLLATLFIAPLTSSIFDDSLVQVQTTIQGLAVPATINWTADSLNFTAFFVEHVARQQPVLPFMTPQYALRPVRLPAKTDAADVTLTATTELYEAELDCDEAVIDMSIYSLIRMSVMHGTMCTRTASPYSPHQRDLTWYTTTAPRWHLRRSL